MHQTGGGGEAHGPSLAGGQPQGHMGLAGADGDDVLPALDVFAACQFHHQGLERRDGSQAFHGRESGSGSTMMSSSSARRRVLGVVHTLDCAAIFP